MLHRRNRGHRIHEVREGDAHAAVITREELLLDEIADRTQFRKTGRVLDREISEEMTAQTGQLLGSLAANRHVIRVFGGDRGDDLLDEVGIERAAESLVRGNDHDEFLAPLPCAEERMGTFLGPVLETDQHLVHEVGVGTAIGGSVLRLLHLGSRNQLHRLGDLGGVLDRLDAAADVSCGGHGNGWA